MERLVVAELDSIRIAGLLADSLPDRFGNALVNAWPVPALDERDDFHLRAGV